MFDANIFGTITHTGGVWSYNNTFPNLLTVTYTDTFGVYNVIGNTYFQNNLLKMKTLLIII